MTGASRIDARFAELRSRGERALVPFVTAGDPDLETTLALLRALADSGADLLEIGVPFSDPIAEGPVIERASERALAAGISLRRVLAACAEVRDEISIPLLLMGYANPFLAMGAEGFAEAASRVGIDGVIIPDLPPEEGAAFYSACQGAGIDPVLLSTPTTTDRRLALLVERTRGFLYHVSLTGVTGARSELSTGIEAAVARIRERSDIPVCVGFGVSTPAHAAEVSRYADGVVVGSAFVDRIARAPGREEAVRVAAGFAAELKAALISGAPR
jgi:tryptophan synthase alpha chain